MEQFTIHSTARHYPRLPYQSMKDDILGPHYQLSLVFVGEQRAQKLNHTRRGKNYIPNVLAFPLDASAGEVYITPVRAKREAAHFLMSPRGYIGYLFIHALLHLKGYHHGDTMEKAEKRHILRYKLT